MYVPSVSIQTRVDSGLPSGITVATVAKFFPFTIRTWCAVSLTTTWNYEKEPAGSFCAQAAMRMGPTDCMAHLPAVGIYRMVLLALIGREKWTRCYGRIESGLAAAHFGVLQAPRLIPSLARSP